MRGKDLELLQWIYKNAEMGCTMIPQVMELTQNQKLNKVLRDQLKEYDAIAQESAKLVMNEGKWPKDPSPFSVAMGDMMLRMRNRGADPVSKLSAMMIKGSTNGTIQMTRRLREYPEATQSLQSLGERLLKTEERNIQQLKQFL